MLQACLSLSLINIVLPSWSLIQPVRLMDLPFSAALASFFSALAVFLSLAPGLAAGSCAARLSEAVITSANNNVTRYFIGSPRVGFASIVLEMLLHERKEG